MRTHKMFLHALKVAIYVYMYICTYVYSYICTYVPTVNGERFTGLNFRGFCRFEEDCESFSMNILHEL